MASSLATQSSNTVNVSNVFSSGKTLEACWLDSHICENGQHQQLKDHFKNMSKLIPKWHFFTTGDQLQDYLQNNPNVKLITIMSGRFARNLLALISEKEALHSVYVLTINIARNREALGVDPKLKGIFNTEDALYDKLRENLAQLFWDEGTRLVASNQDNEARVYFDEAKRLSSR
jgi:hypothetical protein